MKILQKQLNLSRDDYYKVHLEIINALLPIKLSGKEIEVLAGFMSLEKNLTSTDMFNTVTRKMVKDKLKGMSAGSLSNHLKSMLDKGFLTKDDHGLIEVKSFLFPEENAQGYQLKLKVK